MTQCASGVSNGASQSLEVILVPPSDILSGSKLAIASSMPRFRLDPSNSCHEGDERFVFGMALEEFRRGGQ